MNDKDVFIKLDGFKFNFRVAAIMQYKDKVLIQKSCKDDFYGLIGGKVQQKERTVDALKREIEEEIGFYINEKRCKLSRVCENFFHYNLTEYHELLFIYFIELNEDDDIEKNNDFMCIDKKTTKMCWKKIKELEGIDLRPKEAKPILNNTNLKHIIITE